MTEPDKEDTLVVRELFRKFYVCDVCGTPCYFCVTNSFGSLPVPKKCPYKTEDGDPDPEWRALHEGQDKQGEQK